ncbi:MAG: 30S ribosomal protein S6 [Candidatus Sungbacteria bacterium]|nr:30S ribosomal protein S6 [Candidatus Sungbacteria bacterium]
MADPKNYELAYLLSSSVPDEEVLNWTNKLSRAVTDAGGILRRNEEPYRHRLGYPIRKETQAYFGWMTFTAVPEKLAEIKKSIKSFGAILRSLILEEEKETAAARPIRLRTIKTTPSAKPILREAEKPEEKLDLEALDKKLEEILGK